MPQDMTDILHLVRSGRLSEATGAIQERLRGGQAPRSGLRPGPMRDVTPRMRLLTGPAGAEGTPEPQARPTTRPGGTMERREGRVPFRLFRPSAPLADAPLIVMLHGCTQTPEDFAAGTRMNLAADRIGAHVIWPEQTRSANPNGCWSWFDPSHQGRKGEAAAIAAIVSAVSRDVAPEASGIHVAGLSAGGAMAAILGASYPEVFASVGIHSGLPVGAAHDVPSAFAAMRSGRSTARALPVPAIVFHGSADATVAPANGAAIALAARTTVKPRRRTVTKAGRRVTITRIETAEGGPASELWEVEGLGHAWSGGNAAGSYADPKGPDATAEMLRFFGEVGRRAR